MKDGLCVAPTFEADGYLTVALAIPGTEDYVTAKLSPADVQAVINHLKNVLATQASPTLH